MADIKSVQLDEELLKKSEVAAMFRVTERTIESWVSKNVLHTVQLPQTHTVRFSKGAILELIRQQQS